MDVPLDLYNTSRTELTDLILLQRDQIAALEQRLTGREADVAAQRVMIADLSAQLGQALAALTGEYPPPTPHRPRGMPELKHPKPMPLPPPGPPNLVIRSPSPLPPPRDVRSQ